MLKLLASPAVDWIHCQEVHATLPQAAQRICSALRNGPSSCEFTTLLCEEEQIRIAAAIRARLPKQVESSRAAAISRLCREFAATTGYTLLGSKLETLSPLSGRRQLMTIHLESGSRAIPSGPCVFECASVESYAKPIPTSALCALAEARGESDIFENVLCIEPLLKRHRKDGSPVYFQSLAELRAFSTRTIDPMLVGFLPGAPDDVFCIAHWD